MTTFVARPTNRQNANAARAATALSFWRLLVLAGIFALFMLLIIGRLATLALFESSRAYGATTNSLCAGARRYHRPQWHSDWRARSGPMRSG